MGTHGLQTDPKLPTGSVEVHFVGGEPEYDIVHPSAWDAIERTDEVPDDGLLYHGSLALRDQRSRSALQHLRESADAAVFIDVNLRPPWWRQDTVEADLAEAHWAKLNEVELAQLGFAKDGIRRRATEFLEAFGLLGLVVTRGDRGAVTITAAGDFVDAASAGCVKLIDTVGAGDAFSSVMILGLSLGWPLPTVLERAMEFAAAICAQRGATVSDRRFYMQFIEKWGLQEERTRDV